MISPWYTMAYIPLERIAWRHGYALALLRRAIFTIPAAYLKVIYKLTYGS